MTSKIILLIFILLTNYDLFAVDSSQTKNDNKIKKTRTIKKGKFERIISIRYIPSYYFQIYNANTFHCIVDPSTHTRPYAFFQPTDEIVFLGNRNPDYLNYFEFLALDTIAENADTILIYDEIAEFDEDEIRDILIYPNKERKRGIDTTCIVKGLIAKNGLLYYIEENDSTAVGQDYLPEIDNAFLYEAAKAASLVKYDAARKDGKKINSWLNIKVEFKYDDYEPDIISCDDGLTTLANNIKYIRLQKGKGCKLEKGDSVLIKCVVENIDTNEANLMLINNLPVKIKYRTKAFNPYIQDGMLGMKCGEKRKIIIPKKRFYSSDLYKNDNNSINCEVELIELTEND